MQKTRVFAGIIFCLISMNIFAKNPAGQTVKYKLNHSSDRTSSIIRKGNFEISVGSLQTEGEGIYPADIKYDLDILISGKKKGTKTVKVPAKFFDLSYMDNLRKQGQAEEKNFKLKYLGKADVESSIGTFADCDKILVYDVTFGKGLGSDGVEAGIFAAEPEDLTSQSNDASVRDVEVTLYITDRVPTLGAIQIDLSATVSGFSIIAGLDYTP